MVCCLSHPQTWLSVLFLTTFPTEPALMLNQNNIFKNSVNIEPHPPHTHDKTACWLFMYSGVHCIMAEMHPGEPIAAIPSKIWCIRSPSPVNSCLQITGMFTGGGGEDWVDRRAHADRFLIGQALAGHVKPPRGVSPPGLEHVGNAWFPVIPPPPVRVCVCVAFSCLSCRIYIPVRVCVTVSGSNPSAVASGGLPGSCIIVFADHFRRLSQPTLPLPHGLLCV